MGEDYGVTKQGWTSIPWELRYKKRQAEKDEGQLLAKAPSSFPGMLMGIQVSNKYLYIKYMGNENQ